MVDRIRRKVKKMVASLDISYSTLESALEEIKRHINDYGADATIETYELPYEDHEYLGIFKYVDETDEEMTRRIALEERYAEEKEKRDRAEFERLSKKFSQ